MNYMHGINLIYIIFKNNNEHKIKIQPIEYNILLY